ncbi:Cell division cycle-associated protein 2 isoform X3 [Aix galericulata]|nr:Cell division cycle-associated protein 2 isoform X3 [Aix galericulata]
MISWKLEVMRVETAEKEETSFSDLSQDQKICKVTQSKATMASEKENLSDGNQVWLQKHALKYSKVLEKESARSRKDASCPLAECSVDTLKGDVLGEPSWSLNSKENFSRSGPGSLGDECCLPPNRDKAEEKSYCGIVEKQRRKTVDFATVTTTEFGITQESFTSPPVGKSPNALKLRRRSAIGVRGSPENNALIQYLAQQRSNRQKETFTQEWAYKQRNPIEYSDAILIRDILEMSHELSLEIHDESKPPVTPLRVGSASLNECSQSGSQLRSVLKKTPAKELTDCIKKTEQYSSERPKKKKVTFGEDLSPEIFDKTLPANTPLRKGATPGRHPGSQSNSPFTRSRLIEEPLPQPNFDCDDQCVEPLEELREDSVAAEDLSPVENTTVKESDESYTMTTRSSTKRKVSDGDLKSVSGPDHKLEQSWMGTKGHSPWVMRCDLLNGLRASQRGVQQLLLVTHFEEHCTHINLIPSCKDNGMAEREKQLHRRTTGDLELQPGSLQSQSSASSTGFCRSQMGSLEEGGKEGKKERRKEGRKEGKLSNRKTEEENGRMEEVLEEPTVGLEDITAKRKKYYFCTTKKAAVQNHIIQTSCPDSWCPNSTHLIVQMFLPYLYNELHGPGESLSVSTSMVPNTTCSPSKKLSPMMITIAPPVVQPSLGLIALMHDSTNEKDFVPQAADQLVTPVEFQRTTNQEEPRRPDVAMSCSFSQPNHDIPESQPTILTRYQNIFADPLTASVTVI